MHPNPFLDGYSRVSNRHGVCTAQNGPGITNFVTGVAAAYWAHSPVVAITPEAGIIYSHLLSNIQVLLLKGLEVSKKLISCQFSNRSPNFKRM